MYYNTKSIKPQSNILFVSGKNGGILDGQPPI